MGTSIRSEVSKTNRYWLERHRYYELKHFCLQYPLWKKEYQMLDGYRVKSSSIVDICKESNNSDPTAKCAEARLFLGSRIKMIEDCSEETDYILGRYISKAVTEERSFEYLKVKDGIPCCRESYYDAYRRFFWLLSKARE